MARPKSFNVDDALERAMNLFWTDGYERASLSDLLVAMGIQRSSFYNTFEDKRTLFLQALDAYIQRVNVEFIIATLEASTEGRDGITKVFQDYVDHFATDADCKGCLLVNTQVEVAPHDAEVAARIEATTTEVTAAFEQAIKRCQAAGRIKADLDPATTAQFLLNTLTGIRVLGRRTQQRHAFQQIVDTALSVLG